MLREFVGLSWFEVSGVDSCPCWRVIFSGRGGAAGAPTTQIDDISGCGEPDIGRRLGNLTVLGKFSVHVGLELLQANDLSIQSTQETFTNGLKPIPATPALWSARQLSLSLEEI